MLAKATELHRVEPKTEYGSLPDFRDRVGAEAVNRALSLRRPSVFSISSTWVVDAMLIAAPRLFDQYYDEGRCFPGTPPSARDKGSPIVDALDSRLIGLHFPGLRLRRTLICTFLPSSRPAMPAPSRNESLPITHLNAASEHLPKLFYRPTMPSPQRPKSLGEGRRPAARHRPGFRTRRRKPW